MTVNLNKYSFRADDTGAVIIETVLMLPIFFALLFFIIGYAYWNHSKEAMHSSIVKGIRAGATRGNADLMNAYVDTGGISPAQDRMGLISEIEEFHESGDWDTVSVLFRTDNVTSSQAQSKYNEWTNSAFGGTGNLQQMPVEALYSLFYTLEFLRVTLGGLIRFPCDPDTGDPVGDPDRCLRCDFISYKDLGCADTAGNPDPGQCSFIGGTNIPRKRFGIRCKYRPYMFFANMTGLVGAKLDLSVSYSFSYEIEKPEFS